MNRQKALPFGEFEIDKRIDDLNTSITDQNIERAEFGNHFADAGVYLVLNGNIHGNAQGEPASGIELRGGGIGSLLVKICNDDLGTFAGKPDRDLFADPAGCASYYCNLVLQKHGRAPCVDTQAGCIVAEHRNYSP